jgi:hypothetical protein
LSPLGAKGYRNRAIAMLPIDREREAAGRTIAAMLMAYEIKRGGQIHPQTILTEIGALAGFSAQMSIRKAVIAPQQLDPSEVLAEIVTRNGETYYFSDTLNWILFENVTQPPYSIWAYLLDVMQSNGRTRLPDIADIVGYAARTVGTDRFGVPRLPAEHMPRRLPRVALQEHWRSVQQELESSRRSPADWPYDLAYAAQWQMLTSRDRLGLPLPQRSSWKRRFRCRRSIRARYRVRDFRQTPSAVAISSTATAGVMRPSATAVSIRGSFALIAGSDFRRAKTRSSSIAHIHLTCCSRRRAASSPDFSMRLRWSSTVSHSSAMPSPVSAE